MLYMTTLCPQRVVLHSHRHAVGVGPWYTHQRWSGREQKSLPQSHQETEGRDVIWLMKCVIMSMHTLRRNWVLNSCSTCNPVGFIIMFILCFSQFLKLWGFYLFVSFFNRRNLAISTQMLQTNCDSYFPCPSVFMKSFVWSPLAHLWILRATK